MLRRATADAVSHATAARAAEQSRQWRVALGIAAYGGADCVAVQMSALREATLWRRSLGTLVDARHVRVAADTEAVTAMVRAGRWRRALGLVRAMRFSRQQPDSTADVAVVFAHEQGRSWREALAASRCSERRNSAAAAVAQEWRTAMRLLLQWCRTGEVGGAPHSAAAAACVQQTKWFRALGLAEQAAAAGVPVDMSSIIIAATARALRWRAALLQLRSAGGTRPRTAAGHTLVWARRWQIALGLLQLRGSSTAELGAAAAACAAGVRWRTALRLHAAVRHHPNDDRGVRTVLRAASTACRKVAVSVQALELLREHRERWGHVRSRVAVRMCIAACAQDARWREALGLLPMADRPAQQHAVAACRGARAFEPMLELLHGQAAQQTWLSTSAERRAAAAALRMVVVVPPYAGKPRLLTKR
eukprot:TRINITY_DN8833_c0_g1_i1.p2 TRINITY_DN8833_c0_g1~~TRINITY_DN8833_c0_g1_i1.p2  ORF type:complete len:420 (+),score=110.77 TRINITY_DN8833_c0_g1_i1:875-2134(+)